MSDRQHIKIASLDALRGVLALIVVSAHAWQTFILPVQNEKWQSDLFGLSARFAVLAFFCLSGYVIALSASTNIKNNGHFKAGDFALSRFFRIYPPLLIVIAATLLMSAVLKGFNAESLPNSWGGGAETSMS